MDADALRARLARIIKPIETEHDEVAVLPTPPDRIGVRLRSDDAIDFVESELVPAAVLVAIVLGPGSGVLLTKRTSHLKKHAGQVSFPGGRLDPDDPHAEAGALREAEEEIGLLPQDVELVGRLQDYVTGTGFRITPILGLVRPGLDYVPSPDEVETVFQLPMAVLLDADAPQQRRTYYRGRWRTFWVWPHPDHYIWGATAAILVDLAARLREEEHA